MLTYSVLDVVGISRCEQKQYTGRCQYPMFKTKPLVRSNTSHNHSNSSLLFWCRAKQCLTHTINLSPQLHDTRKAAVVDALAKFLDFAEDHCEDLDEFLQAEALVMSRVLQQQTAVNNLPFVFSKLLDTIDDIQKVLFFLSYIHLLFRYVSRFISILT